MSSDQSQKDRWYTVEGELFKEEYASWGVYRISDGSVNYTLLGHTAEEAMDSLHQHLKDLGEEEYLKEYTEVRALHPDYAITLNYMDHNLKITLKAKEWAAIFDAHRPEWNIIGCTEWV